MMAASWQENVFGIWVPWLGIMLILAAAMLVTFLLVNRRGNSPMKAMAVLMFLTFFALGLYVVLTPGDPLSRVPIFINGALCLVYAVATVWKFLRQYKMVQR